MAKKPTPPPTIAEIAKQAKARRGAPEDKTLWMRDLKKKNPELAAEILAYVKEWRFVPGSEASIDCETKNELRAAIQATLDAHGFSITIEKTTFASFINRLERAHEQGQ